MDGCSKTRIVDIDREKDKDSEYIVHRHVRLGTPTGPHLPITK